MNEVTNSRAEVEAMLRSVIQSSKGGVLISNLQKEYKLLVGKNVPFKLLGYPTMEAMLRDMPDIVRIVRNSSGEEVVNAVVNENTAHLASLVARQKSSKSASKIKMPKRRPHREPFGRKVQNSQYLPRVSHQSQNSYGNFIHTEYNSQNKNVSVTKQPSEHLHSSSLRKISTIRKPSRNLPPRFMRLHRIPSSPPAVLPSESFKELSEPVVTVPNNWIDTDSLQPIISEELVSNRDIIESYAISKGITATFRNIPLNKRELPFTYISTLMIDGQKFNSYPNDKPTEEEAEEEASRVAVEALDLRPGQESQNLKTCSVNSYEEVKIMLDRIFQIIDGKQNGLWNMKVESVYKETYREMLPPNWIKLITEFGYNIHVNHVGENRSILYPSQRNTVVQNEKTYRVKTPEPLILPDTEYWDVFVSYLTSTKDIAVQLIDYSEVYEKLVSEMQAYYKENRKPIQKIVEGQLYAAFWDNCWNRVRAINVMEELAECYFVDHGDSEILNFSYLYELEPRFANLPFQAIKCQLDGLTDYAENKIMLHHLTEKDLILGKTLVAEVIKRGELISLVLYDTSTDEDINLNQYLIEITEKETITPKLPKIGGISKVYLSHVDDNGDIYVQVCGPALQLLDNLMNEFNTHYEKNMDLEKVKSLIMGKMYCINYRNNWYRAVVKAIPFDQQNKEIEMICVDYGNTALLSIANIYELGQLSDILSGLPYQAIKCVLHGIPPSENLQWSKLTAKHLLKLTPEHQILLLKVVTEASAVNPAKVELFKRIEPYDELVSINQTLALCTDIFSVKENSVDNSDWLKSEKCLKPLTFQTDFSSESICLKSFTNGIPVQYLTLQEENRTSKHYSVITPDGIGEQVCDVLNLDDLIPPVLPSIGEYFDVHIINTAHPHNFICQPWKHGAALDLLFEEMQSFYSLEENTIDMDACLLKKGHFYAGKHNEKWKRVWVKDIINEDMVSAYFVDYGGYSLIGLTDLQPLWKYFRSLPCQAIMAELYGVEPREKDWTPLHCMYFKQLVEGKEFVSVIKKKVQDRSTGLNGEKISLILIDTSDPDKDVYIDKILQDAEIINLVFHR